MTITRQAPLFFDRVQMTTARLDRFTRNHLPGQHDQRDHGRRRNGIRRALMDAGSLAELATVAKKEARRASGQDVTFDFTGSELQVAREHAEGVLRGLERFPEVPLRAVRTVDTFTSNAYAHQRPGYGMRGGIVVEESILEFNSAYANNPAKYYQSIEDDANSRWSMSGGSPMGIAIHEFGHAMSHFSGSRPSVESHVRSRFKAPGVGKAGIARLVGKEVSHYASTNFEELSAEVFADVILNGDDASPLSKELFEVMEAEYRAQITEIDARRGRLVSS